MIYNLFKGLPTLQPPSQADPGFPPKKKSRFKSRRQVCVCILTDMPKFPNRDANLWGSKIWRPSLFALTPPPLPNINRPLPSPSPPPPTDKHKLTQSPNCNMENVLDIRIVYEVLYEAHTIKVCFYHDKITVKLRKL